MKKAFYILFLCCSCIIAQAQEDLGRTFKDTRVINAHTVETIQKKQLDVRIGHRFGELKGGWSTFYGLENAEDVLIGAAYGISDNLSIGLHRTKGAGSLKRLVSSTLKYRFLRQKQGGSPVTITALGIASISTMNKSDNVDVLHFFDKFSHRMVYAGQILIARKFSDRFSLQLAPGFVHRNIVPFLQPNDLFTVAIATRLQITRSMGIIFDATIPLNDKYFFDEFYPAMGIGLEIETGGHIFQVNFTNAKAIMETDYIPYTQSNWLDGEFRLGFTVSRIFNL